MPGRREAADVLPFRTLATGPGDVPRARSAIRILIPTGSPLFQTIFHPSLNLKITVSPLSIPSIPHFSLLPHNSVQDAGKIHAIAPYGTRCGQIHFRRASQETGKIHADAPHKRRANPWPMRPPRFRKRFAPSASAGSISLNSIIFR